MTVTIRPALMADAYAIELRPSDLHEGALRVPGQDVEAMLKNAIQHSTQAVTAVEAGRVLAVFGFSSRDGLVTPWLMCSELELRHNKLLLRLARVALAAIGRDFPDSLITNFVGRDNTPARSFLNHLGFQVLPTPGRSEFDLFYLPLCASQ